MFWLFIFLVIAFPVINSSCPIVKNCLHNGLFNTTTCICDCQAAYKGVKHNLLVISKRVKILFSKGDLCQYSNCINEPPACTQDLGPAFCSNALISNYCPLMCNQIICKCGFDSCSNGGTFISSACVCLCAAQYVGDRCDNLVTTTKATTLTSMNCTEKLPCLNGAKYNELTCKCECKRFFFTIY